MPNVNFGVELELSTSSNVKVSDIVRAIRSGASVSIKDMTQDYSGARSRNDIWKIMSDASLTCSISNPGCNKFELVSPVSVKTARLFCTLLCANLLYTSFELTRIIQTRF